MATGRRWGYRELLMTLGRAAGLSSLALATLGSGPCGSCFEGDECASPEELKTARDEGVASAIAGTDSYKKSLVETANQWSGSGCPTADQYRAIGGLKDTGRYGGSRVDLISQASDRCCYHVVEDCPGGRPFLVDGRPRVAGLSNAGTLCPPQSPAQADNPWLRDAQMEHASVAAFARLSLQLLALGAPSSLVRDAQLASLDELRHADCFFGLASRHAGSTLGPAALDVSGALDDLSLAALIESNLVEGCIGETLAAEQLRRRAEGVADAETRAALLAIAEDETRHAELAFRILAWCRDTAPQVTRDIVQRVLSDEEPHHHGDEAWQEVLSPLLGALC
jgi:hypothetical protein